MSATHVSRRSEDAVLARSFKILGREASRVFGETDGLRHAAYISGGLFLLIAVIKLLGA